MDFGVSAIILNSMLTLRCYLLLLFPSFNPEYSATQIKEEDEEEEISPSFVSVPQPNVKEPKKRGRPKKVKDER